MGKTITPKYRLQIIDQSGAHYQGWQGKATTARLNETVAKLNESMKPGGVNAHLALKARGFIPYISTARIINQMTGEIVAEYAAPLFMVS